MLTTQDRDYLLQRLIEKIDSGGSPRAALVPGLALHLRQQLAGGSPFSLADSALTLCSNDAYSVDPPAMVQLIDFFLNQDARALTIIQRVRHPPPAAADPLNSVITLSKLPFLERLALRNALRGFLVPLPVKSVIVVNSGIKDGVRLQGKSHTTEFIEHVAMHQTNIRLCKVTLPPNQGTATGAGELTDDIISTLGGDPERPKRGLTNDERWTKELVNHVIIQATLTPRNWWFVLDGFNAGEVRLDTRLFIGHLALAINNGVAKERHRLVLIDFDRTALTLVPGNIHHDLTAPLSHASVHDVVAQILQAIPGQQNPTPIAARILENFSDPITNVAELGKRLCSFIEATQP